MSGKRRKHLGVSGKRTKRLSVRKEEKAFGGVRKEDKASSSAINVGECFCNQLYKSEQTSKKLTGQ